MTEINEEIIKLKAELSQYKLIEENLKGEIAHLRHHIDNARIFAVYQLIVDHSNESFRVSFVSPSFKEIVGVTEPMIHDNWMKALHPDDEEMVAIANQKAFRETNKLHVVARMYHPQKREWRYQQFMATAKTDNDGKPKWVDGIVFDITEQKRAELKMLEYQSRLQKLTQRQFASEQRESLRVAEVLHDDIGQDLSLALFKMNQAREAENALGPVLDDVSTLIEQAISYTRSLTKELCPPALCQMGLSAGINWLVERTQEHFGIAATLEIKGDIDKLDEELGILIFRIIAELINNTAKHGHAHNIAVKISLIEGELTLAAKDDGIGFNYSDEEIYKSDGFGLFMISERLRSRGGKIRIESADGHGTKVLAMVPILE